LKRVFEPCYGNGAIAKVLEANGFQVTIQRDKYTLPNKHDFLIDELPDPGWYDVIITNTPFAKKIDFFQRLIQTNKPFAATFPLDIICRLRNKNVSGIHILISKVNMVFDRDGKRQQIGTQCVWFLGNFDAYKGGLTLEYL
jgi:hypothetical protein